jgi:hypothetical protein
MKTAVREQVNDRDAVAFFTLLAELMKTNPPPAADAPELARFARIGLVPGQDFDAGKLDADFADRVARAGFDRVMLQFKINPIMQDINGWGYTIKTGLYGTDYPMRALVAAIGLGANRPQDKPGAGRRQIMTWGESEMRTPRPSPAVLALTLCAGLSACTASKDVQQVEAQEKAPIDCATAEGDVRVLQSEKASVGDEIARGVTAIVPAGAVVGLVGGQEKAKLQIASGDYNRMIDQRIAAIRARCGLPQ